MVEVLFVATGGEDRTAVERRRSCLGGRCWGKMMGQVLALGGSIALTIGVTAAETGGMIIGRAHASIPRVFELWTPDGPRDPQRG